MDGSNTGWIELPWPEYNAAAGATYPACGNIDDDELAELAVGIDGFAEGGRIALFDDHQTDSFIGWPRVQWADYNTAVGSTRPTLPPVSQPGGSPLITAPASGSTLGGTTVQMEWSGNGSGALEYWVYAGSSVGGSQYYDSTNIGQVTSTELVGLPQDGSTVYVRLWYRLPADSNWYFVDGSYTAAASGGIPALTAPPSGDTLDDSEQTFEWSAGGATEFWLYIGDRIGGREYFDSSNIGGAVSVLATGLPEDGTTVYARLWYRVPNDSTWNFIDDSYTASIDSGNPTITSPQSDATLGGSSQLFEWSTGDANEFWLYVGDSIGGRQYFDSSSVGGGTSVLATGLPEDGTTVYSRLWYRLPGDSRWYFTDDSYTASTSGGEPVFTTPQPGTVLNGSDQVFEWSADGSSAGDFWLYIGSSVGGRQYYDGGNVGSVTSDIATGLPEDGSTIYARLWYRLQGDSTWYFVDETFVASQ